MGWDEFIVIRDKIVYKPFGVFSTAPAADLVSKNKVFLTTNLVSGNILEKGVAQPLKANSLYELKSDETFYVRPLVEGETFRVNKSDGVFDGYKVISGSLQKVTGDIWIDAVPVNTAPKLADMAPGIVYYRALVNTDGTQPARTWTLNDEGTQIIEGILKTGQFLYNPLINQQSFFNGISFVDISLPYPAQLISLKNVKIYNDDGTPRAVPRAELIDTYSLESGRKTTYGPGLQNHLVLLANQTVETERWVYQFTSLLNSPTFTWTRQAPTRAALLSPVGFITVEVQQGDDAGTYRCWSKSPYVNPANNRSFVRAFQPNAADNTPVFWKKDDPGETARLELEKQINANKASIQANKDAITAKDAEIATLKTKIETLSVGGITAETDPIATAQIATLKTTVDGLGVDTLKTSVTTLTAQLKTLDDSKASQADLDALKKAQADLTTALAALPKTGATPEQLKAVDDRVKALESAISTAENSKGILNQDVRSHFLVAGNLYGGIRRLVSSDIDRLNQRAGYEAENPYRALDGIGQTGLTNASNQWLTWFTKTTMRVWRIEITHINNNWAVRSFKRNGTQVLGLNDWAGTHTDVYRPKASTGHEAFTSMQFVDDGGDSVISNLYASVTDSANPAAAPSVAGTTLQVGDRFRFQTTDGVSALFTYQGTDSASGAWKATPVAATSDSDLARYTVVNPRLDNHDTAIAALENQVTNVGNTITRIETRAPEEDDIGGWHYWTQYQPLLSTAIWRKWEWLGENNIALLFDRVISRNLSKTAAKYDQTTKLYSLTFDGLQFQFATEGQLKFQMPGADSKFTNLRWQAFAADGAEIGNGGSTTVFDSQNPTFNTNISANPTLAQGRAITKIRYTLTPIAGNEFSFEVTV